MGCDINNLSDIFSFTSDATVSLRAASEYNNYLFGYSKAIARRISKGNLWASGVAFVGGKVSYTSVDTLANTLKLTELRDNAETLGLLKDMINSRTTTKNTGFGLDLAATWFSQRYSANVTVNNIFAPDIAYSDGYTVTQNIVPSLGGTLFLSQSQSWAIRLQNDFAATKSIVGAEYQWRIVGLSYISRRWYIPDIEIAKRWNLAGTQLSYTALGINIAKAFQANLAVSDEKISGVPRGRAFSFGFGFSF